MAFTAQYTTECAYCGEKISPGDPIVRLLPGGWKHEGCDILKITKPREVCEVCWLEKPCACD